MTAWTQDEIQTASTLWNDGLSAAQVGNRIGRNRQQILGIAYRHRDLFPNKPPSGGRRSENGPSVFSAPSRSKAIAKKPVASKPQRWPQIAAGPVADKRRSTKVSMAVVPDRADPNFTPRRPVTILMLDSTTCRWPLWGIKENPGSDGLYCGEVTVEDSSWCPHHKHLSIGRGTDSERRAVKVLEREAA